MVIEQTSSDLKDDSIHIWRIDLDGPTHDLYGLLSAKEIKRAQDRRQEIERKRFILAHGAMRSILGEYLGISGAELAFIHGEKGKPSLDHPKVNIKFNLTHCEDMALLAVADAIPVGIDLERIRSRPMQLKIAQRMFPPAIYQELLQLSADRLDATFFKHWTELEARAKCLGGGIFSADDARDCITISHFSPQDGWMACVAAKGLDVSTLELKHFLYRN